jgi:hypothetical protein
MYLDPEMVIPIWLEAFGIWLFFIVIRWYTLTAFQRHEDNLMKGIWYQDVLGRVRGTANQSLRERRDAMKSQYDAYVNAAGSDAQQKYTRKVMLLPYFLILFIGWIAMFVGLSGLIGSNQVILALSKGWLVPLGLVGVLDIVSLKWQDLMRALSGPTDWLPKIMLLIIGPVITTLLFVVLPISIVDVMDEWVAFLGFIFVLLPNIIRFWGGTPWKVTEQFVHKLQSSKNELGQCIAALVLLEDIHEHTFSSFVESSLIFLGHIESERVPTSASDEDDSESSSTEQRLSELSRDVESILGKGKNLLSGQLKTHDERENIVNQLLEVHRHNDAESIAWCLDRYLGVAEEIGYNPTQLKIAYSFTNPTYLSWVIAKDPGIFIEIHSVRIALRPAVLQVHMGTKSEDVINILTSIAARHVQQGVADNALAMGTILSEVGKLSGLVENLIDFFSFVENVHLEERKLLELFLDFEEVAAIVMAHTSYSADWSLLRNLYRRTISMGLDVNIIGACYSFESMVHIDAAELIGEYLKTQGSASDLAIFYRRLIGGFMGESRTEILSQVIGEIAITHWSDTYDIRHTFTLAKRTADKLENFDEEILTRFPDSNQGYAAEIADTLFAGMFELPDDDALLLLLASYGTRRAGVGVGYALGCAILLVEQPIGWIESNPLGTQVFATLPSVDKKNLVSILFVATNDVVNEYGCSEVISSLNQFLGVMSDVVIHFHGLPSAGHLLPILKRVFRRYDSAFDTFERITGCSWVVYASNLDTSEGSPDYLYSTILSEYNDAVVSLSFGLAGGYHDLAGLAESLSRSSEASDASILSLFRFWSTQSSSRESQMLKTISDFLVQRYGVEISLKDHVNDTVSKVTRAMASLFSSIITTMYEDEDAILSSDDSAKLLQAMVVKRPRVAGQLEVFRFLVRSVSRIIAFAADNRLVSSQKLDALHLHGVWDALLDQDMTNPQLKSELTYKTVCSILADATTGGEDIDYVAFLVAIITNATHNHSLRILDEIARVKVADSSTALRYADIYADAYIRADDILLIAYDSLIEKYAERIDRLEYDKDFKEIEAERLLNLKNDILSGPGWILRQRILTDEEDAKAQLRARIHEMARKLSEVKEQRIELGELIRKAVHCRISNPTVLRFISRQTYNYFLIAWHSKTIEGEGRFSVIINRWLMNHEHELGYPFLLSQGTRVGKIPKGLTFEGFKEKAAREINRLCEEVGMKPRMFIVNWSPSPFSAHAISTPDSLSLDTIQALRKVFGGASTDRSKEIEHFIEQSVVGQLSMADAVEAMSIGWMSLFKVWKTDPLQVLELVTLTEEEEGTLRNYKREIRTLLEQMQENAGGLAELALLGDYDKLVGRFDKMVFKKGTRESTKGSVKGVVVVLLQVLRTVLQVQEPLTDE